MSSDARSIFKASLFAQPVRYSRPCGFTLLELLITIAIAGIAAAIAIPSFQTTIKNNQMVNGANETIGALNYARSEAVNRGNTVYIGPRTGGGLVVWVDGNSGTKATYDADEELRLWEPLGGDLELSTSASQFSFTASGGVKGSADITICDSSRTNETGRLITVLASGMIAVDDKTDCG